MEDEDKKIKTIPGPDERPDLYDYYDGLPEGRKSSVKMPPEFEKMIKERKSKR